MNVIEVNNVSKKFRLGASSGDLRERVSSLFTRKSREDEAARDFWALQDISFNVTQGESFGIIGHNGSGKSTLLKLLTGIYKPTSGTFKTHGRISALIEVGAGFHPDLTGRENVYLNGSVLGLKRREIDRLFDEIVAFSELEQFIDTPVKRYSSGMYMRLGFAVAAHVNPDIVLVDEVLAVGDESFQKKCMDKMLELRREGKTIVFISHSMDAMAALCQRVMLLSHGRQLAVGQPSDIISLYRSSVVADRDGRQQTIEKNGSNSNHSLIVAPQKALEITNVRLLNLNGDEINSVSMGAGIRIECTFRANERIEDPAYGVSIYREDGLYIFGFNSKYDGVSVDPATGVGCFSIVFPEFNLLQSAYYFNVGLCRQSDTHNPIDARSNAAMLTVTSPTLNQGTVDIARYWELPDMNATVHGHLSTPSYKAGSVAKLEPALVID